LPRSAGMPEGKGGSRASFWLETLGDFSTGLSRARDFEESLRVALMTVMGTLSVVKGVLFVEEDGEFRAMASRGVPPGIPPLDETAVCRSIGRARTAAPVRRNGKADGASRIAALVEEAVPVFRAELFCPLATRKKVLGFILLGPSLTGAPTAAGRQALGVMISLLAQHLSDNQVIREVTRLNSVLRRKASENGRLLQGMREIFLDTIRALATAIEAKDPYTRGHSERVARVSVALARELGMADDEIKAVHVASILHDVGKIGTDGAILAKPGALTRGEYREIQRHPRTSYEIISEIRFPYPDVALIARHHHERVDGSGYPDGRRGDQIPIGARIIAVADAFDAMVSDRPYRRGLPLRQALDEIRRCRSRQFDPVVAGAFFRVLRAELSGGVNGSRLLPVSPANGGGAALREARELLEGAAWL
jgi:putative nucleotidyltransferase with HDIG domain